jgi:hypothetical protein
MSVANFGPSFRQQSVANLLAADIVIPTTANGAAAVVTPLIQTAAGAEIPLVLGEGVWSITAKCAVNPNNGAETYQYFQSLLFEAGNIVAATAPVFGADVLDATNVGLILSLSYTLYVPHGQSRSMTYRFRSTGNPARTIEILSGAFSDIVAVKLN